MLIGDFVFWEEEQTITCHQCHEALREKDRFCSSCGSIAPVVIKSFPCPNCGGKHLFADTFRIFRKKQKSPHCTQCGEELWPELHPDYQFDVSILGTAVQLDNRTRALVAFLVILQARVSSPQTEYRALVGELAAGPNKGTLKQYHFDHYLAYALQNIQALLELDQEFFKRRQRSSSVVAAGPGGVAVGGDLQGSVIVTDRGGKYQISAEQITGAAIGDGAQVVMKLGSIVRVKMSRLDDLESHLRASYGLIIEYEELLTIEERPNKRLEWQRGIDYQWSLIRGYLAEYQRLVKEFAHRLPEDISAVVSGFESWSRQATHGLN